MLLMFAESIIFPKFHLYGRIKKYDGTDESLLDKSHIPLSPHPNSHTKEELFWIVSLHRRNPNISLCEMYGKLVS